MNWTKNLRDISNPDKHRKLTALGSIGRSVMLTIYLNDNGAFGPAPFQQPTGGTVVSRYDIDLDASDAIAISGTDPSEPSFMRILRDIEGEVFGTISTFSDQIG